MTTNTKRLISTLATAMIPVVGFWVGGFDFNERGGHALIAYTSVVLAAGFQFFAPWWRE